MMAILKGKKRISQELQDINTCPVLNWTAEPIDAENMFRWQVTLVGPGGSVYEGGIFFLDIQFPAGYPLTPPRLTFITRIYHPNINKDGAIRATILGSGWKPEFTISDVFTAINTLLLSPDIDNPFSDEVARIYREDNSRYEAMAREWTKRYAM